MARASATLLLLFFGAISVIACDTSSAYEGCVDPKDPSKPGTDPHSCPPSTFADQDFRGRDISGTVRRGEDGVAGAEVHVSPSAILPADATAITADVSADAVGFYRVSGHVASRYDLLLKLPNGVGGRDDVMEYRGVAVRAFEPQLDVPGRTLPRSWSGHVDIRFDAPVESDHAILFLANGTNVFGVTGDLSTGLSVHTLDFVDTATIHAVEYDPTKGLVSATKYGKADIVSDAANPKVLTLHLDPITGAATPQLSLVAPPGFVPGAVDIRIGSARTSDALLVSIPWGTTMSVPLIPNQGFTYQLKATRVDGAISDSGEIGFDVLKPATITLPTPPVVQGPPVLSQIKAGDGLFMTTGSGVLEHVFEPIEPGGAGLRILVESAAETPFPDMTLINETKVTGAYNWSVRRFADLPYVEAITGADARRYHPVATSPPRPVFLR